jgi:hypothetical protein
MADCTDCGKPVADTGYICHHCTATLATTLLEAAGILDELPTTVARLDRIERPNTPRPATDDPPPRPGTGVRRPGMDLRVRTPNPGSALSPKALPINLDAAEIQAHATRTIQLWANHIAATRGVPIPGPPVPLVGPPCAGPDPFDPGGWCRHPSCVTIRGRPAGSVLAGAVKFVAAHLGWLRMRPESAVAWADLRRVYRRTVEVVDRPEPLLYTGPCWGFQFPDGPCPRELYVEVGQEWVRCPRCRTTHQVAARREWLLREARAWDAPLTELAKFLGAYGAGTVSKDLPGLLRKWASRNELLMWRVDAAGQKRFRVGDALDLLERTARTDRRGRRAQGVAAAA